MSFRESEVEAAALAWLEEAGWRVVRDADIAPGVAGAEREDYGKAVLGRRLMAALERLNPGLPQDALDDAHGRLVRPEGVELVQRNRQLHQMMTNGVEVEYLDEAGNNRGGLVRVIDFEDPAGNDWLVANQFTVAEHGNERQADLVLFVNGLPLVVVELKSAADEDATVCSVWRQCQAYMAEIPTLFAHNVLIVVSDGTEAQAGTLTAGWPWLKPWRAMTGGTRPGPARPELQAMIDELLAPRCLLDRMCGFVVFEPITGSDKAMTSPHDKWLERMPDNMRSQFSHDEDLGLTATFASGQICISYGELCSITVINHIDGEEERTTEWSGDISDKDDFDDGMNVLTAIYEVMIYT